ncbi:phosphotransferase [Streptomyces sp. DT73]|uniref:phosphotransferase n=1 Tax=Streptomyces sp. DT73 TaxID=3393420 RepID=UPI003CEAB3E0
MDTTEWQLVKPRTADADGAVYVSADGRRYRRTGGQALRREAAFQQQATDWGYPVPRVLEQGRLPEGRFFVDEVSVGTQSLHERALASLCAGTGELADQVVDELAAVSSRLLTAQSHHPAADARTDELRAWVEQAGWMDNLRTENPDLDAPRLRAALARAVDDVAGLPLVWSHLDYGLPNVLPGGVIDWQHHDVAPLGYDVALALEVIPFKGGTKGYTATPEQRTRYLAALDTAARAAGAPPVSPHLGAFLMVKSLFFLALMRPVDPARADKHQKWQYRRHLVLTGVEQYERTGTIDTSQFPTLDTFAAGQGTAGRP